MKVFRISIIILFPLIIGGVVFYYLTRGSALEKNFFSVEGATYKNAPIPQPDEGQESKTDIIFDIILNKTVINGGSNIINFTSEVLLNRAMIGAKEAEGYLDIPLQGVYDEAYNLYKYTIILLMSQKLDTDFGLNFAVESEQGFISKTYDTDLSVIEVGTGSLQISLSWNIDDDVDLHVVEPDGDRIYYASKRSFPSGMDVNRFYFDRNIWILKKYNPGKNYEFDFGSTISRLKLKAHMLLLPSTVKLKDETTLYIRENKIAYSGELDLDSNPACNIDGIRNENIFYVKPEPGSYNVFINLYSKCITNRQLDGAKYSVTVTYDGKEMKLDEGKENLIGQFSADMQSNGNKEENYVFICKFTIPGEPVKPQPKEKIDISLSLEDLKEDLKKILE